jgi:hypothetical protein
VVKATLADGVTPQKVLSPSSANETVLVASSAIATDKVVFFILPPYIERLNSLKQETSQ